MTLRLRYRTVEGGATCELRSAAVRVGRSGENDLVLADPSVSRAHCEIVPVEQGWLLRDLGSTNGVQVRGSSVQSALLRPGDWLTIGTFELLVEDDAPAVAADPPPETGALADAMLIKRLDELPLAGGGATTLVPSSLLRAARGGTLGAGGPPSSPLPAESPTGSVDDVVVGTEAIEHTVGQGERLLGALLSFAGLLLATETVDEILQGVVDAAFDALDVERGFVFLSDPAGELRCELARIGDDSRPRPEGPLPVSETLLRTVVDNRVALVTGDAPSDARLAGGESLRIHQIRSALCAPLWSGERVVGVVQLDTPFRGDAFDERDLELITALANYAAVAIERQRQARSAELERRRRSGLERYHSPAVVEEILRRSDDGAERALASAEVSVLFADLVGFSSFAEAASPQQVATLLGEFFDRSVGEIFARGGTLDKFIGDCVMAVFGAPVAQSDHADRAVAAGLALQEKVKRWNSSRAASGAPDVAIRVAINSGPVVAGEIGSESRVEYTVLGDTVNVAARLESSVAAPGEVIIGPRTRSLLSPGPRVEELGDQRLEGLSRQVAAYRVWPAAGAPPTPG